MSNSGLVSHVHISPNKNSPRNHIIDTITIHCVVGQCTVETLGNVFAPPERKGSSNYGIGYDGKIGLYVDEADRSWCTSNADNDNRAVTIEVASDTFEPYAVKKAAYDSLIDLVTDICQRNKIKKLVWSTDKNQRVNHLNGCNMTVHRDYANKSCPGEYLYQRHGQIASEVNRRLGISPEPTQNDDVSYRIAKASQETIEVITDLDIAKIKPYIATIGKDTTLFDIPRFKEVGGCGIIVDLGQYVKDGQGFSFSNNKYKMQIQSLIDGDIAYGVRISTSAKTKIEAEKELDDLRYFIYKYDPGIGLWIDISKIVSSNKIEEVLSVYKLKLEDMGMKGKIGIYLSKKKSTGKFDYFNWTADFALWNEDSIDSIDLNKDIFSQISSSMFEL